MALALVAACLATVPAQGAEPASPAAVVEHYALTLSPETESSAELVGSVRFAAPVPSEALLPLPAAESYRLVDAHSDGQPVQVRFVHEGAVWELRLSGLHSAEVDFVLALERKPSEAKGEHGERLDALLLVNTSAFRFDEVEVELGLLPGERVERVLKATPAPSSKSPDLPYVITSRGVTQRCAKLERGGRCGIEFSASPSARPGWPLLLGGALALGWLVAFVGLVRKQRAAKSA